MKARLLSIIFVVLMTATLFGNGVARKPAAHRAPMKPQMENSLLDRQLAKKVHASVIIADMESPGPAGAAWSMEGIAQMNFTKERSIDGVQSLRFHSPYRNEEFIRKTTAENGYFNAGSGTGSNARLAFNAPQDWTVYNRISAWIYVHPQDQRTYIARMGFNCLDAPRNATSPRSSVILQNLKPGEWNHVVWEIANLRRDKVASFSIGLTHRGNDNGDHGGSETYDIDHIELQQVNAEKFEGWEIAPGRIAFSHVGYKPGQVKTAVASGTSAGTFELIDAASGKAVISRPVRELRNERGSFEVMEFTDVRKEGKYYLRIGELESRTFIISDTLWRQPIYKCINGFYGLRCGYDLPGIHDECHRDWQGTHNGVTKIINGGWHDAGDLSQGSFRTGKAIYAMLDIVGQLSKRGTDPELEEIVLDEALWGLDWLLKTRFGDGYRMTWSMMRIYTDGIVGNDDDVKVPADNMPWENFLASGVESRAFEILRERNRPMAETSLEAAVEDWEAAVGKEEEWIREGDQSIGSFGASNGTYLTASWGVVSSVNLYRITGKEKYADHAVKYGNLLMQCQERSFKDGIPITGYFYTGPKKLSILHHIHPAFEESPLLALSSLCAAFPGHRDWIEWYGAATLHAEYFMKRGTGYSKPFELIPNSVYRRSEIMSIPEDEIRGDSGIPDPRIDILRQFEEGTRLTDEYHLRIFPIWGGSSFHGNTAVHLSETQALVSAVLLRSDLAGEDVVARQLQWVFGGNPFSQSLMYGEGYDFPSLFAFNPGDIVGTLPVGMDCMSGDAPYWDDCNLATYKEIWVVPMSRFLWNASMLAFPASVRGTASGGPGSVSFFNRSTGKKFAVRTGDAGTFEACLPAGEYEVGCGGLKTSLAMVSGGNYLLSLDPESFIDIRAEAAKGGANGVVIKAVVTGAGSHSIALHAFNGTTVSAERTVELAHGEKQIIEWELLPIAADGPWVAVIIPNGDPTLKRELTGSFTD